MTPQPGSERAAVRNIFRLSYVREDDPEKRLYHLNYRPVPAVGDTIVHHKRKGIDGGEPLIVVSRWFDYYADGLTQVTCTVRALPTPPSDPSASSGQAQQAGSGRAGEETT